MGVGLRSDLVGSERAHAWRARGVSVMPRYQYRETIALTLDAVEVVLPVFGRYDQSGYAVNWFPQQYALKSVPNLTGERMPAPYGSLGQPISPHDSSG